MQTITVVIQDDDGEEQEIELPAQYVVCPKCGGEGTHLHPSIGEHAYSLEEFCEEFDEEGQQEYFRRGGIYDVTCTRCAGLRVVLVVDRDHADAELLHRYDEWCDEEEDYERMCAAERRFGA